MYSKQDDGRLQVIAAASLLEKSRLVKWSVEEAQFNPVPKNDFDISWQQDIDPVFGRLICWMMFSAGAEYLAKGVCLVNGIEIRKEQDIPQYPLNDIDIWASTFLETPQSMGVIKVTHFGTLGDILPQKTKKDSPRALDLLCNKMNASKTERNRLLASYELLRSSIRNRDAHAYVPNVRDNQYLLVPELFSGSFNILLSWLPNGPGTLNTWKMMASSFVASL